MMFINIVFDICFISQHKYQISLDGTVAAYRLPYLLAGDALVLKQESPFYEHFYKDLKPFEHYIPFKRDLSDLMEKIQWAKDNDAQVLDFNPYQSGLLWLVITLKVTVSRSPGKM